MRFYCLKYASFRGWYVNAIIISLCIHYRWIGTLHEHEGKKSFIKMSFWNLIRLVIKTILKDLKTNVNVRFTKYRAFKCLEHPKVQFDNECQTLNNSNWTILNQPL